ncbi:glutathione S-transferase [Gammaproteobacteria bacterium LSUCC0112]|nr:glutathione S-transferase [Gammaproteobacteria bacterium LSUCC0112]
MEKLTFYTNPRSRGRIVRWMLEETGAAYDTAIMNYGGNIKSPEYLPINPMGKVPAIKHCGTVVTEVIGICAYLADQFPDQQLAPMVDSPQRGSYYRWLFFAAGPLEMAMTATSYNWDINETNVQAVGCGYISDTVNTLELALNKSPFCALLI